MLTIYFKRNMIAKKSLKKSFKVILQLASRRVVHNWLQSGLSPVLIRAQQISFVRDIIYMFVDVHP